jgi:hypothetical protein
MAYSNVSLVLNQHNSMHYVHEWNHAAPIYLYSSTFCKHHCTDKHLVLLHEQANSRAPLLGLIKMAAAGMYQQLSFDKRLQPTYTPKKTCNYKSLYSCEYVWKYTLLTISPEQIQLHSYYRAHRLNTPNTRNGRVLSFTDDWILT